MPKGKLQSPFFGRYEKVDASTPILYPRWTGTSSDPVQSSETSADKASTRKRARLESSAPSNGVDKMQEDTSASLDPSANGRAAKRKQPKERKAAEQHPVVPSGPGNAEEAQEMRQKLGYTARQPAQTTQTATGPFGFGFQLKQVDAQTLPASSLVSTAGAPVVVDPNPPPGPRKKQKREQQQKSRENDRASEQQPPEASDSGAAAGPGVPRRVFVGGMPFSMEEDDVRGYWSECGTIEDLDLMRFSDTGRFKGIAFITFAEEEGYQAALSCHEEELQGQVVRVEPCHTAAAKPKQPTAKGNQDSHAAAAPKTPGYPVAYVGNVSFNVTVKQLREVFKACSITRVRLHTDKNTGQSKGFAHVHFADEASLDRAVQLDGYELDGRNIKVGYGQPKR